MCAGGRSAVAAVTFNSLRCGLDDRDAVESARLAPFCPYMISAGCQRAGWMTGWIDRMNLRWPKQGAPKAARKSFRHPGALYSGRRARLAPWISRLSIGTSVRAMTGRGRRDVQRPLRPVPSIRARVGGLDPSRSAPDRVSRSTVRAGPGQKGRAPRGFPTGPVALPLVRLRATLLGSFAKAWSA